MKLRTDRAVIAYVVFVISMALLVTHVILHFGLSVEDHQRIWKLASMICVVLGLTLGSFGGRMIHKNSILCDKLEFWANHDQLTGCYSRRKFFDLSKNAELYPAALIVVDLDHFKKVNDQFGHCGGDDALRHLITVLDMAKRKGDILARLGGEEFVVLLPNTSEEIGEAMAWSMLQALRKSEVDIHGKPLIMTGSFGVAQVVRGEDIDLAVHNADVAMYAAKSRGRNQVCVYSGGEVGQVLAHNVLSLAQLADRALRARAVPRH